MIIYYTIIIIIIIIYYNNDINNGDDNNHNNINNNNNNKIPYNNNINNNDDDNKWYQVHQYGIILAQHGMVGYAPREYVGLAYWMGWPCLWELLLVWLHGGTWGWTCWGVLLLLLL